MGSTSGVGAPPPPQAPDYTSTVQAKIESKIGSIDGLMQDIASLIAELQALPVPQNPGSDASDKAKEKYQQELQTFRDKVAELKGRIEDTKERLNTAQNELATLQNQDMPAAQRREAEAMAEQLEAEAKRLEEASKQLEDIQGAGAEGVDGAPTNAQLAQQADTQAQFESQLGSDFKQPGGSGIGIDVP